MLSFTSYALAVLVLGPQSVAPTSPPISGTYVLADGPDNVLELRKDGTYLLQEGPRRMEGRWQSRGSQLVLNIELALRVDGDAIVGPDGRRWLPNASPVVDRNRSSANEASAIADIRVLLVSQAAYSNRNGGAYGDIACLAEPADCITDYGIAPPFLDKRVAVPLASRNGYVFRFVPGKPIPPTAGIGKRSLAGFVYTATPTDPGKSGVRGFAADETGIICFTRNGQPPPMTGPCDVVP